MSRQAITNPSWNPNTFNSDITLLRLSTPAQLGPRVAPVCLAPANLNLPSNLQCVTTGWGRVNPNCTYAAASGGLHAATVLLGGPAGPGCAWGLRGDLPSPGRV